MNWVKKPKFPAIEELQYNGQSCIETNDLWQTLHQIFNLVQNYQINPSLLNETPQKQAIEWPLSSKEEFKSTITEYNNLFTLGPDCIS